MYLLVAIGLVSTTAPFFFELYKDKIFCRRYEQLRLIETLRSQDALFAYSSLRDGEFFVKTSDRADVFHGAQAEVAYMKARALLAKTKV